MRTPEELVSELPVPDVAGVARARAEADRRTIDYPYGSGQAEEIALLAGLRPLIRQQLDPASMAVARTRFERLGLVTDTTTVSVRGTKSCFDREVTERRLLFAGRDEGRILAAVAAEVACDDEADVQLGRLLGYPRCCVEAFVALPTPRLNPPLWLQASRCTHGGFAPRLNVLDLAVFHFISWVPCSYDCALSSKYADAVAALVGKRHPDFLRRIDGALGAHRLVLAENVQLSLSGPMSAAAVRIERVWATANDRRADAPLGETEREAVARALVLTRAAKTIAVHDGIVVLDGAPVQGMEGGALFPFGAG